MHRNPLAAGRIGRPAFGQVEPPVQRGIARRGGVRQEDADLAVGEFAQPAAPLATGAAGVRLGHA